MLEFIAANTIVRLIVLAVIFAAVLGAVLFAANIYLHRQARLTRLHEIDEAEPVAVTGMRSLRSLANDGAWSRLAAAVEAAGIDLSDTRQDRLAGHLQLAGYTSTAAPRVFTLVRLLLVFALPIAYLLLDYWTGDPPGFMRAYIVSALLAVIGLYLPNLFVQSRIERRREAIRNGFPDCLELLIVCVESGLGLEAAIDRVGREMVRSHPRVAELLSMTTLLLRAGASRDEAFRKLGKAADVEEVRSFTTLLIQSDKLGTSITATLRVYASEMRERRKLRAEERAYRLPVLISIPLVVCMLPTMIGVLMLPAVIRMVRDVIPAMLQGG
ncbi:type II secretion system F family protein [Alteraurantiacibacter aestuarii]|uniref:Type II secretion system F family protein n=1 Tax=Alteraurantiacibacter aestuarii TaxID=650004 RepID=A0A844ZJ52_9SPHN|nr:type II secretion system F family protein [Alteraurantiacibacter aestuarii]MXO87614.1 type II secretion system F family protein [Alteraurantiacibacter aestuarii]